MVFIFVNMVFIFGTLFVVSDLLIFLGEVDQIWGPDYIHKIPKLMAKTKK